MVILLRAKLISIAAILFVAGYLLLWTQLHTVGTAILLVSVLFGIAGLMVGGARKNEIPRAA